jgi:hypothetical protein
MKNRILHVEVRDHSVIPAQAEVHIAVVPERRTPTTEVPGRLRHREMPAQRDAAHDPEVGGIVLGLGPGLTQLVLEKTFVGCQRGQLLPCLQDRSWAR